jgi:tetratricopeptide (TPR) repeat protein
MSEGAYCPMRHGGGRSFPTRRPASALRARGWLRGAAFCCLGSAAPVMAVEPPAALTGHIEAIALTPWGTESLQPIPRDQNMVRESIDAPLEDPPGLDSREERGQSQITAFDAGHTEAMELVAQEADAHTRRGFELAGRRAYFSAREEFIHALRTLSQALDVEQGVSTHSAALAAGMRALDEAEDFVPRGASLEAHLDVSMLVTAHATPVYRYESLEGVTPLVARQRYYTYAREQLGVCSGRELAGSMALHGLGKLSAAMAGERGERLSSTEAEAMVYFQAALLASPQNHMAANDLGTLMASKGNWSEARNLFLQSLESQESPVAWNNLAKAHKRLGENDLAARAEKEAKAALAAATPKAGVKAPSTAVKVEWVKPDSMTAAEHEQFLNNQPTAAPTAVTANEPPVAQEASPSASRGWWPWKSTNNAK